MTETVHTDYEVQSTGAPCHLEIPYARLADATPTPTNAARVTGILPGQELTGTVLTIDAGTSVAVIDFTPGEVYMHDVRNVLTYAGGPAEASWGAINIGDPIYYDATATMPAGVYLSTSPLGGGGAANALYGRAVAAGDVDMALYPKGGAAASTQRCAVVQRGAGA